MGNNQNDWVDLRTDDGHLYGRLHRLTLGLQIVRRDREVLFDLVATAREGCAVAQSRVVPNTKERSLS